MRIDGSGRVGIGTSEPSQTLHIDGHMAMSGVPLRRWRRSIPPSGNSLTIQVNGTEVARFVPNVGGGRHAFACVKTPLDGHLRAVTLRQNDAEETGNA